MHENTKLTTPLRKEIYKKWRTGKFSLRGLAAEYHVNKKVIQRIAKRGKQGDFLVHDSTNLKYKEKSGR